MPFLTNFDNTINEKNLYKTKFLFCISLDYISRRGQTECFFRRYNTIISTYVSTWILVGSLALENLGSKVLHVTIPCISMFFSHILIINSKSAM